jgi:nanoRNase/pAp phosphatase (c-di-AMP/oligoRNAs hydrolase)
MFYGIQSDTQDLGREAGPPDVRAYQDLFFLADKKKLSRIRQAKVPPEYFKMLADSLANCVIAGATVISWIPACQDADMIAEVADRMMRLDGMRTAVCYGVCGNTIHLSARTTDARGTVAKRMMRVVKHLGAGGGHATMAGGQIPVNADPEKQIAVIRARILKVFAPNKKPVPLLAGSSRNAP